MRYLFPVPAEPLRSMLDALAQTDRKFRFEEATIDVMLALDRGDLKPTRYYAKRWKWSVSTVHGNLPKLKQAAADWRNWFKQEPNAAERSPNKTRPKQGQKRNNPNSAERSPNSIDQYYNTTIGEEKDIYVISDLPAPAEVMKSWNDFASRTGLAPIRKITAARAGAIRKRRAEIWPDIDTIYAKIEASDFLRGATGWRIDFDFLWGRTDAATKILEGKYDNGNSKSTQRRIEQDYPDQFAA